MFFTDSQLGPTVGAAPTSFGNSETYASNLYELANTGSTTAVGTYTSTPVLLESFTDSTASQYDDVMSGVAADRTNGIVYFSTKTDGIWGFANNGTAFTPTSLPKLYAVAGQNGTTADPGNMQGGKGLAVGAPGTLYAVGFDPGSSYKDDLYELTFGVNMPNAQYSGSNVTAPAAVVDNANGYCNSPAATLEFAFAGTNASDFAGTQGSGCNGIAPNGTFSRALYASSYPATITFAPNHPGSQTVTATVADTTNGGEGTATVSALSQTTPETVSFSSPANNSSYTYTAPPSPVTIPLTVANGPSNFPATFSIDASSTGAGTLSSTTISGTNSLATLTVTQAGTIVIDAVEPAGLASNHIYYSVSNTAQLTLAINQASQTITFTPIAQSTYTYAAAPNQVTISLSATGGASGNPVEFSVDASSTGTATITPSSLVGSASLATLTVTGAGTIVIDADQAASTDYAAGSLQNAQTLTVNQAAQTITFVSPTQPIHFIAGGITVPITAKGGGSNNPITFTIDPSSTMTATIGPSTVSGANSTATLTIPAQGAVVSGNIVLDATQPQSANYAAASATPLVTLAILASLPTQTITFANPGTQVVGTSVTLSATASSTLPVTYTSSTTSVCTLVGSVVSFNANIATVSTCTIMVTQPGDNTNWAAAAPVTQSFTVNPTGQKPSISVGLSLSALTIQPGTSGLTQLTVTSLNNFTGSMAITCSGLPSGYTCTANPNPVSIAEGGTATTTITVTPPAGSAMVHHDSPLAPLAALAFALGFLGFRKRTRLQLLVVLALGLTA
ncbi:MAG: beta strand repeat-containing protein, partial [Terracidiphilus sp.]